MAAAAVRSSKAVDLHNPVYSQSSASAPEASAGDATAAVQKLEGRWSLQGKTERSDASGSLEMCGGEGPILQFGNTRLYLSPIPTSCEQSYNQTRYSFEVTDACTSSGIAEDVGEGDPFDSEAEAGDFGGQPELPGECDMVVKADGSIEGDASASPSCSCNDICFKFTGQRITTPS
jgi:hypothetical protein